MDESWVRTVVAVVAASCGVAAVVVVLGRRYFRLGGRCFQQRRRDLQLHRGVAATLSVGLLDGRNRPDLARGLRAPRRCPNEHATYAARVPRAGLDKDPRAVAAMFDGVARRYDLTNTVLSFGQDRQWRKVTRAALNAQPGEQVLDLAAGSGVSTVEFARSGAWCVAADFSLGMLSVGRDRGVPRVAADALRLPFADDAFDAVTILFGLRNLVDLEAGLREMARVVRSGGRLVICEFSSPTWRPFRTVYMNYVMRALSPIARAVSSNPEAYVYLAESIRAWPDQRQLAEKIGRCGWQRVVWRDLTGGAVAVHHAVKPD